MSYSYPQSPTIVSLLQGDVVEEYWKALIAGLAMDDAPGCSTLFMLGGCACVLGLVGLLLYSST